MKFDVKNLYVLNGRRVGDISRLKHGGYYVASGPERFKRVEYRVAEDGITPRKRNGVLPPLKKEAAEPASTKWRSASRKAFIASSMSNPIGAGHKARKPEALSEATDRSVPAARLRLEWVYGYRGHKCRNNVHYSAAGEVVYFAAAVGIVYNPDKHTQRFFMGHSDDIISLALHPERTLVATGQVGDESGKVGSVPYVCVWDSNTTQAVSILKGMHAMGARILAFDSTGERLVSVGVGPQPEAVVWDWGKGQVLGKGVALDRQPEIVVWDWSKGQVLGKDVAPDRYVQQPEIVVWDWSKGQVLGKGVALDRQPEIVVWDWSKGQVLGKDVAPDRQPEIVVWDWGKGQVLGKDVALDRVFDVKFNPWKPEQLVTCGVDHLQFWTLSPEGGMTSEEGDFTDSSRKAALLSVAFGSGDVVYSGTEKGDVYVWRDGKLSAQEVVQNAHESKVVFVEAQLTADPRGSARVRGFSSVSSDGTVNLYDENFSQTNTLKLGEGDRDLSVCSLAFSPTARTVLVGTTTNELLEVDISEPDAPRTVHELVQGHGPGELRALAVHPSEPSFLTSGEDHTVRIWSMKDRSPVLRREVHDGTVMAAAFSPDGSHIALGMKDGKIEILYKRDMSQKTVHVTSDTLGQAVRDLKYSPDGRYLAAASHDGRVAVFDPTANYDSVRQFPAGSYPVMHIDWSTDSRFLQTNDEQGERQVYKMPEGKMANKRDDLSAIAWETWTGVLGDEVQGIWPKYSDLSDVNTADVNFDHGVMVTGDDQGLVKLFRFPCIRKGAKFRKYGGHADHVTNVRFSCEGSRVVSIGGADSTVFQWKLLPDVQDVDASVTGELSLRYRRVITVFQWKLLPDVQDVDASVTGELSLSSSGNCCRTFRATRTAGTSALQVSYHCVIAALSLRYSRVITVFQWKLLPDIPGYDNGPDASVTGALSSRYRCVITVFQWKLLPDTPGYDNGLDASVTGESSLCYSRVITVFQWKLLPDITGYDNGGDASVTGELSLRFITVFQWKLLPDIPGYDNGGDASVTDYLSSDEEQEDSDVSDADLDSDVEQEAEVTYDRHVAKDDVKKRKKSFKYLTSGVDRNKPPYESLQLKFVHGYRAQDCRNNLHYTRNGEVVYHVAAVGIVYERDSHSQRFYLQHTDDILCLTKHPTDDIFATGQVGKDPAIHVWESENMENLAVLQGQHARGVCELDFTAAGTRLASVGLDDDHSIVIWDWKTATPLAKTKGHKDKIFGVQWNPYDSARFVTIGIKHVKFWTMSGNSFTSRRGIFGSAGEINTMVSVAHGGTPEDVYTGAPSGQVYVWRGNNLARTVQAHSGPCFSVKVDGHDILTAGKDGVVCVWTEDFAKCVKRFTINRHFLRSGQGALLEDKPPVRTVCPGEGTVLVGTKNGEVLELDRATGKFAILAQGAVLVGTKNGEVLELDRATGKFAILAQGHMGRHRENELWGLATHPTKHIVATVSDDRTLRLWDVAENVMLAARRLEVGGRCADFSPDGRLLAVGQNNGSFFVLHLESWEVKTKFHHRKEKISDIRFSPDGKYLAVASHENHVDVYNMEKGKRVGICKGASSYITHIDWEGTGRVLQVNSGARERLFFEVPRCKHLPMREPDKTLQWYTWTGVLGPLSSGVWPAGCDVTDVNAVSASHDWSLLAAADDFGFVKLFRFPCDGDYAKFKKYLGHSSHVTNVRWSHDDTRLMTTGGMDTSLMVWVRRRSAPRDDGACESDDSDTDLEDGEDVEEEDEDDDVVDEVEKSRALFAMADVDSDGTVTSSELAKALRKLGYRPTEADIRDILAAADDDDTEGTNGDSGVDPGESDSLDFDRFHLALTSYRDRWVR
ncbi:EML6 [Branchiostoma lanceolatum]|uniref:EML6 protein n=1 Tax=Branchiostoma lanceolatum TaxID=7740 RepID=A0A8J9Z1C7_BRALA|nr:EML6 [Branchiostoma lanceolatum]